LAAGVLPGSRLVSIPEKTIPLLPVDAAAPVGCHLYARDAAPASVGPNPVPPSGSRSPQHLGFLSAAGCVNLHYSSLANWQRLQGQHASTEDFPSANSAGIYPWIGV